MSKTVFTQSEVKILLANKYVRNVSSKSITYTDEFKSIFITENELGLTPKQIFEKYGFDVDVIGMNRVSQAGKRWRAKYNKDGKIGLEDKRKINSGRTLNHELSLEEKYGRLQAEIQLLKAENELLKKIELLERGMIKKK